jgi:hypothetical protein
MNWEAFGRNESWSNKVLYPELDVHESVHHDTNIKITKKMNYID